MRTEPSRRHRAFQMPSGLRGRPGLWPRTCDAMGSYRTARADGRGQAPTSNPNSRTSRERYRNRSAVSPRETLREESRGEKAGIRHSPAAADGSGTRGAFSEFTAADLNMAQRIRFRGPFRLHSPKPRGRGAMERTCCQELGRDRKTCESEPESGWFGLRALPRC